MSKFKFMINLSLKRLNLKNLDLLFFLQNTSGRNTNLKVNFWIETKRARTKQFKLSVV